MTQDFSDQLNLITASTGNCRNVIIYNIPQSNEVKNYLETIPSARRINNVAEVTLAEYIKKHGRKSSTVSTILSDDFNIVATTIDYADEKYTTLYTVDTMPLRVSDLHVTFDTIKSMAYLANSLKKNYIAILDWSEALPIESIPGFDNLIFK
ncbi:MAG: hypothetical protein K2H98_10315 [Duncaniella sp.]|nr:hypothetical protein [Duncaniella sp.]